MKQVNAQNPKPPSPISILLIGPPGGGKTTLAMQFPDVLFEMCDDGLDGPDKFNRSLKPDLSYSYETIRYDDTGKAIDIESCFDYLLGRLDAACNYPQIRTVAVDNLTHVNEFIIRKVLKQQGNKTVMEPHFWNPFKSFAYNLLVVKLGSLKKSVICLCHEENISEGDDKKIGQRTIVGYKPAFQSKIQDMMGGFFTDIWRCTTVGAPGGRQDFVLTTSRTQKSDYLKNSVGLPSEIICPQGQRMYDKISKYLVGRL